MAAQSGDEIAAERSGIVGKVSIQDVVDLANLSWIHLATEWASAPVQNPAVIAGGTVYDYTYDGGIIYFRFVPDIYDSGLDKFYSSFDGSVLSGELASRG